jgi:hypothetical protein
LSKQALAQTATIAAATIIGGCAGGGNTGSLGSFEPSLRRAALAPTNTFTGGGVDAAVGVW